ncbi:Ig-like domain repeat protein [Tundrisphaera lichenicola]|uniref:Ig-like domain repeat protein n=1 Tax=Tundrisphaera lichenicola TaxID=2029860 RepID=UPI003EBF2493
MIRRSVDDAKRDQARRPLRDRRRAAPPKRKWTPEALDALERRLVMTGGPAVSSIVRAIPSGPLTSETSVTYTVTFNQAVDNVSSDDFKVVASGGGLQYQAPVIVSASQGTVFSVEIDGIRGSGTLRLDLIDHDSIAALNGDGPIGGVGDYNGSYQGQSYTINQVFPTVLSIEGTTPTIGATDASTLVYTVTFNKDVTGVTVDDFTLELTGTASGTISAVAPVDASVYEVTISGVAGQGELFLKLANDGTIRDLTGNPLRGPEGSFLFEPAESYPSINNPTYMETGDLNGDGKLDLVTTNGGGGNMNLVAVLLGNGDGTFGSPTSYSTETSKAGQLRLADLDGDGDLDVVLVDPFDDVVVVMKGNGDGTLGSPTTFATGNSPNGIAVADLNGDGISDVVTADENDDTVSVLLGNGDGTFGGAVPYATGSSTYGVAIGDVNGDGRPDLVASNYGDDNISVLLGNGDGTFGTQQTFDSGGYPYFLTLADVDNDGNLDVVHGSEADSEAFVLLGNGDGTFAAPIGYDLGTNAEVLTVADVDGDGHLDIFGNSLLLLGNGDGTFGEPIDLAEAELESMVIGDFNADGRPDLAGSNYYNDSADVLLSATGEYVGPTYTILQATTTTLEASPSDPVHGQSIVFTANVAALGSPAVGGTVTFRDGSTVLDIVPIDQFGSATYSTTSLSIAGSQHSITAEYTPGAGYGTSTGTLSLVVDKATPVVTSVVVPTSLTFGQSTMVSVIVTTPFSTPVTGTADILIDGQVATTVALVNGLATYQAENIGGGSHSIVIHYNGDPTLNEATSSSTNVSVSTAPSSVAVTPILPSGAIFGAPLIVNATVSSEVGIPSGQVQLLRDNQVIATATLDGAGQAQFTTTFTAIGTYTYSVAYLGSSDHSVSSGTALNGVSVARGTSSTSLLTPATADQGNAVTLTATVSGQFGLVQDGTVTFSVNGTPIGTGTVGLNGVATLITTDLPGGTNEVSASFDGGSSFLASGAQAVAITIRGQSQAGEVVSSTPQAFFGQNVTLTATFSATAIDGLTLTGTVDFFDGDVYLGTATLAPLTQGNLLGGAGLQASPLADPSITSGQATLPTTALSVGDHVIRAVYSGDANYASATSETPVSVLITTTITSTTLAVSTTPEGTVLDALVQVVSPGDPTVQGTVSFFNGQTLLGTVPIVNGHAILNIGVLPAGQYAFSATFSGGGESSAGESSSSVELLGDSTIGYVYLDLNASGRPDAGEPGLASRVVFADLNGNGKLDPGEPTATTDSGGHFTLAGVAVGSAGIFEATSRDVSRRIVVDQFHNEANGELAIGVTPISPVAPVPVVLDPASTNPPTNPNAAYIGSLYRAVLGREGGAKEIAVWLRLMAKGATQDQVARGFVNSREHRIHQVVTYYHQFLHRAPDPSSKFWVKSLLSGVSEEKIVKSFLASPEYQKAHQDPARYIRDLYLDVLGRRGEDAGVHAWLANLSAGMTRRAIEAYFVDSPEAIDQLVTSFYASYLRRQPDPTSARWSTELSSPRGSATDVAIGFLTSEEFIKRARRGRS